MNKIFKVKRNSAGQLVVCSEKSRVRGKVKAVVLAMAAVSSMLSSVDVMAATAISSTAGTVSTDGDVDGSLAITSLGTAKAGGGNSIAIGSNSNAVEKDSLAVGSLSTATGIGTIAIGTRARTLLGVVDGKLPLTTAIGFNSSVSGYRSLVIGAENNVTGSHSVGIGTSLGVHGNNSVRIGSDHRLGGANPIIEDNIVEIGVNTRSAANSVVIGYNAVVQKDADASSNNLNIRSVAIGADSWVGKGQGKTLNGVALGAGASVTHSNSVALGSDSASSQAQDVRNAILGGIQYGDFAGNTSNGSVSVGSSSAMAAFSRQVKNVAAGAITVTSTDAINGSQLYAVANNLGNLANSIKTELGGNAALSSNGTITVTNIGGTGQDNIHDAIAFVNAKQGTLTNVVSGDGIVVTDSTANGEKTFTVGLAPAVKADVAKGIADAAKAQTVADQAVADAKVAQNTANSANATANRVVATTYTFGVANGQTAATTTTGTADTWRTTAADSLTLGATTDLSVSTDGAGKVIYGLSDATKANITKAQTDAAKGIADAKAADAKAVAAQNTANTAVTKADAAQSTANKAVADIKTLDDIAVKYDSTAKDTITLAGADGTTITNVKAGAISANSTDAVNGGQLYALTEKVNNLDATDVVAGRGVTVTKSTQGNLNTYTVSVSNATLSDIAKAQADATKGIADAAAAQNTANTAVTKADAAQATANANKVAIGALDDKKADKSALAATDAKVKANEDAIAKGFNVKTSDGTSTNYQLGDTVSILGGKNIDTTTTADGITVSLKDDITVKTIAIDGSTVGLSATGINAGDLKVTGVADGAITADSKDAVNGGQLYAIKGVADAAQATANANKVAIGALDDKKADKSALAATDAKVKALDDMVVKYDSTAKDTVTLGGADGTTIANVKAGAISANSTDAVNGSQLFDVYNYVNQGNDAMRNHINQVEDELQAAVAGSNAAAALPQVRNDGKSMLAFAMGAFEDKGALAVGYSRASDNGKTVFKAHLNANTENKFGGGVGMGFEW